MTEKVKWELEADYLQGCNCDYGCPCEYEAPPTQGFCEGILVWRINHGHYGDVSLDGLGVSVALHSPGPLHKGNITVAPFLDVKANERQREGLLKILTAQDGGMPFEVMATLVSKIIEPRFVPFEFNVMPRNASVKIGDAASMALEPIKNPVTGQPEGIRIEHDTGFLFKGAEVVSTKECRVSAGELSFSYPDKCGFITKVKYSN